MDGDAEPHAWRQGNFVRMGSSRLARQLGVKWDTAWLIKQKLMEVMRQRYAIYKLEGDVQIDDAYLGSEKPGKVGRGAPGARVLSDGLGCFGGLADTELKHRAIVMGSGRPKDERLKWTNSYE
jgi:hypothetical protein